jgi:hypothetical protein
VKLGGTITSLRKAKASIITVIAQASISSLNLAGDFLGEVRCMTPDSVRDCIG